MGKKYSRVKNTEQMLEKDGIKFVTPNNKSVRLFFESQFNKDMDINDISYLNHIFEVKTYLYFQKHFKISNMMNVHNYLKEEFKRLKDNKFKQTEEIQIENTGVLDKLLHETISFIHEKNKYIMLINDTLEINDSFFEQISFLNINDEFLEKLKKSQVLKIFIKLNYNASLVYFIFQKILKLPNNIKKIKLYQVGLSCVDEEAFLLYAQLIENHKNIDNIVIKGKLIEDFRDLEDDSKSMNEDDIVMINEVQNKTYVFTMYEILATRNNLIELRLLVFLEDHSLVLISHILQNNKGLRILEIRNMIQGNFNHHELDYTFKTYNELGDSIKDEIYIFFNYVSILENLEKLIITNFWFNSDINFFASEITKCFLKKLRVLKLDHNQSIISNDSVLLENYELSTTNLEVLSLSHVYYQFVRKFESLINKNVLKEINLGVVDSSTFACFIKFISCTTLKKIKITLNKPIEYESIKFVFKLIASNIFNVVNLRSITFINTYTEETFNNHRKEIEQYVQKYFFPKIVLSKTIRKISLKHRTHNISSYLMKKFFYIKEKNHYHSYAILYLLKKIKLTDKQIQKLVIYHLYIKYRKISI